MRIEFMLKIRILNEFFYLELYLLMTRINTQNPAYHAIPTITQRSPLMETPKKRYPIRTIQDFWHILNLYWWSEVETRFLFKNGKPANYIDGQKTNHLLFDFITENYPSIHPTFESSAHMIETDTWLCTSYEELCTKLEVINTMKQDICKRFWLKEAPARVTDQEMEEEFVNPLHPKIMKLYTWPESIDEVYTFAQQHAWNKSYGLDKVSPERVYYILDIQSKLPSDVLKYTQTTSQQLTISSQVSEHPLSTTIRLYAQLTNYITEHHLITPGRDTQRTWRRWAQFSQVVDRRSQHNLWVAGGNKSKFAWVEYPKYVRKNYFPFDMIDGYTIGDMANFRMSHRPMSLKFWVDDAWVIHSRAEFRSADSARNTLNVQKKIDRMFLNFARSKWAGMPMYIYDKAEIAANR